MEPKPANFDQYTYWKYGASDDSTEKRIISGSVVLYVMTDNQNIVSIRHLVVEGSSQWLTGRDVTRRCNVEYIRTDSIWLADCFQ